jgi:hypothetical protein
VGVVSHEVVTPSIGVDVSVDVGVVELSIDVAAVKVPSIHVAAVKVPSVHVAAVKVPSVHIAPVDVASMDVTGRSISDSRSTASTASPDSVASPASTGLRYAQPHAAHNQQDESYDNLSHGSLLINKQLFLPIYSTLRLQSVAWLHRRDSRECLEKTLLQGRKNPKKKPATKRSPLCPRVSLESGKTLSGLLLARRSC